MARRTALALGALLLAAAAPVAAATLTEISGPATVTVEAERVRVPITVAPTLPPAPPPTRPPGSCHPSYPTVCIPPPPPDLDCPEVPFVDFVVVGDDPHRLDQDNDGIGCESQ